MSKSLSVNRVENKYILSRDKISNLSFKLDKVLRRDDNSTNGSYIVRSLYFDSINNIDFNTKLAGSEIRKKIRIRVYDPKANKCKLEMKQKNGSLQHKVSMWISKDDALELMGQNYSVLLKYMDENEDAKLFYTTMLLGCYIPVVMIEYDRIAYTYGLYNTRITLDMNVRSSETNFNLFDDNPIYTNVINDTVLEIKYDTKLIGFLAELFKPYKLNAISVSKYCYSRKVFYDFNF